MNKSELIDALAAQLQGSKKDATTAVESVLEHITRSVVAGEKVALAGFGTFQKVARKARTARNPLTGAAVKVKATSVIKFKPAVQLKEVVSGARKLGAPAKAAKPAAKKPAAKKAAVKKAAAKKPAAKKAVKKVVAKKPAAKKAAAKKPAAKKAVKKAAKRR
ncbi:MAG TPA: HU family DNA-binding protein [Candidatus Nanopelagicaceae bacterium]|nr:HU family DNA-binding protein [Candidatus Nanopelagicaceae bacterium]